MGLDIEDRDGILIITPDYTNINMAVREELGQAIARAKELGSKGVVLNLHLVDLIDSIGLGAIISGRLQLRDICDVHLCGMSGAVESAIHMSRLDLVFKLHDHVGKAIEAIQSAAK
jgi:anti-sigma B factor antagonist